MAWRWAFIAWTLFVWLGRIRNAVGDPALATGGRTGPILLSLSFVIPALLLAGMTALQLAHRDDHRLARPVSLILAALVVWTAAVWVVRAVDIALRSDRGAAFIAVHLVLATVSVGLGVMAVRADRRSPAPSAVAAGEAAS
jgi:hypothetical protein